MVINPSGDNSLVKTSTLYYTSKIHKHFIVCSEFTISIWRRELHGIRIANFYLYSDYPKFLGIYFLDFRSFQSFFHSQNGIEKLL